MVSLVNGGEMGGKKEECGREDDTGEGEGWNQNRSISGHEIGAVFHL